MCTNPFGSFLLASLWVRTTASGVLVKDKGLGERWVLLEKGMWEDYEVIRKCRVTEEQSGSGTGWKGDKGAGWQESELGWGG